MTDAPKKVGMHKVKVCPECEWCAGCGHRPSCSFAPEVKGET